MSGLDGLNPAQREAVRHGEGPLLIVAGAGTGKTRVVTTRVAHLLAGGVPDRRVLAITFTNKAAREMRERVDSLLPGRRVWVSTFHAFGARALRIDGSAVGVPEDFAICDRDDQVAVVRRLLKARGERDLRPEAVLEWVSRWKSRGVSPVDVVGTCPDPLEALAAELYQEYSEALTSEHLVDFDDLLIKTRELVCASVLSDRWADRFDHVLVDEYQDTNAIQCEITRALSQRTRNLSVCGDPDQSIYSWRGADLGNILGFRERYPDAKVVRLERNYRSTAGILAVANQVIAHNTQRIERSLYAEENPGVAPSLSPAESDIEEAETIASQILELLNTTEDRPSDIAVLYRTNALSRTLERSLRAAGVPYRLIGAVQFFARREIKDLLAFLRLRGHPWDAESFLRIVNTPSRGIGEKSQGILLQALRESGLPILDFLCNPETCPSLRGVAARGLRELVQLLEWLQAADGDDLVGMVEEVLRRLDYFKFLRATYGPSGDDRVENVRELLADLHEYQREAESPSVRDYLELRALVQDIDANQGASGHEVQLMTFHASKGLEFRSVFLCGLEETILPHRRSIEEGDVEEERRLFYVGITRARERLFLSYAARRFQFGSSDWTEPSRFLREIPGELLQSRAGEVASGWDDAEFFDPDPVGDRPLSFETPSAGDAEYALDEPTLVLDDDAGAKGMDAAAAHPEVRPTAGHTGAGSRPQFNWEVGDHVQHERFGVGWIVGVDGWGRRMQVQVDFGGELKTIHLGYTQLRKILEHES